MLLSFLSTYAFNLKIINANKVFDRLVEQDRLKKMLKLPFRFTKQDDTENSFLRFLSLGNSNNICPIQKINILLYIIKKRISNIIETAGRKNKMNETKATKTFEIT